MAKVLLARVDRIGDLVLTLPLEKVWRKERPTDEILWLVSDGLKFVVENSDIRGKVFFTASGGGLRAALALASVLKGEKIDRVLAIHVPWWVALAFFLAGIKERMGVASQWFSWFFFNRRVRQKRSQALKHEAQYNVELVEFALGRKNLSFEPARLTAPHQKTKEWREFLVGHGVGSDFVVIHPGMGGSARNLPPLAYRSVAEKLIRAGIPVVLSGSSMDEKFISQTGIGAMKGVVDLTGRTGGEDLLAVLSQARAVIAPSTGVAHLSASLGVPVAGIYSPVRVQAPRRWAPLGPKVKIFEPVVDCPGVHCCLGEKCRLFDCMNQIDVDSIVSYAMEDKL